MKYAITLGFVFLTITGTAQRNAIFKESIRQRIDSLKYNQIDALNRKQGFWLILTEKNYIDRTIILFTYSGNYFNNHKVGPWDLKSYDSIITDRDVYLDTSENNRISIYYYDSGKPMVEGMWLFDKTVCDTTFELNKEETDIVEVVRPGKFLKTGIWKEYWENGRIKTVGEFIKGEPVGKWVYFSETGIRLQSDKPIETRLLKKIN